MFSKKLTINLDLIVLQFLSSLISGHTCISPSILFFSIENLQCSPTCEHMVDECYKDVPAVGQYSL